MYRCILAANKHDAWLKHDYSTESHGHKDLLLTSDGVNMARMLDVGFVECCARGGKAVNMAVKECIRDCWYREENYWRDE